jgi:acetolactate synthase-1/2/3 large subunit
MRTADKVWQIVKSYTDTVYYVPGGGAMFLVDALGRSGLNMVSPIHEGGAGIAALGHARTTDGLGVCLVTSGPGVSNAITACLAAWSDSVPVLFISGQSRSEQILSSFTRVRGSQYANAVGMVKGITKLAYEPLTSGHDCIMALENMISECLSGRRGPCWLSVPQNVQGMKV